MIQTRSTTEILSSTATRVPAAALFALSGSDGSWSELTASGFRTRVRALAKGFLAAGVLPESRIAVLCSPRFESTLVDFAAGMIAATVVALPDGASQSELLTILDDEGVSAVVVETARDFARFDELHGDLPAVTNVWQVDLGDLEKCSAAGESSAATELDAELDAASARTTRSTEAMVFFPTGADGERRRASLTHGQLVDRVRGLAADLAIVAGTESSWLQLLPSNDVHSRITGLVTVATGTRLGFVPGDADVLSSLTSFRPTLVIGVPPVFAELAARGEERAQTGGRGPAYRQALDVAVEYSVAQTHNTLSRGLRTRHALAETLVYRSIRKAFGGRLGIVLSIAEHDSLPDRLRHLMRSLDIQPLEAFGTAATAGLITLERSTDPFDRPTGTVGRSLDGVEVAIDHDGRILVSGAGIGTTPGETTTCTEQGTLDALGRLVLTERGSAPEQAPTAPAAGS